MNMIGIILICVGSLIAFVINTMLIVAVLKIPDILVELKSLRSQKMKYDYEILKTLKRISGEVVE